MACSGGDEEVIDRGVERTRAGYGERRIFCLNAGQFMHDLGGLTGIALLAYRIRELDLCQSSSFFLPHIVCAGILFILGMEGITPTATTGEKVRRVLSIVFYVWDTPRFFKYCGRMVRHEGVKVCSAYLMECNQKRFVRSVRDMGWVTLSAYFQISAKTDWSASARDDIVTAVVFIWYYLMTLSASWSYEKRYHEYVHSLHLVVEGSVTTHRDYPHVSFCMEGLLLLWCHAIALGWWLHLLVYVLLLNPAIAPIAWIFMMSWRALSNYTLESLGFAPITGLIRSPSFKRRLTPDDFLFTSPSTLLCSCTSVSALKKFGVITLKDLLPMLICQTILFLWSSNTDHHVVRELPYHHHSVEEGPASINLLFFKFKATNAEMELSIPKYFRAGDPVGFSFCGVYVLVLLSFFLYAHFWVRRCVSFPSEVTRDLFRKLCSLATEWETNGEKFFITLLTASDYKFETLFAILKKAMLRDGHNQWSHMLFNGCELMMESESSELPVASQSNDLQFVGERLEEYLRTVGPEGKKLISLRLLALFEICGLSIMEAAVHDEVAEARIIQAGGESEQVGDKTGGIDLNDNCSNILMLSSEAF